ncbi:hypothetical protein GQ43DRAFT_135568 [Delitschia confertaspora ATCC 74209]|uniref:Uncharacterized protein n=1 Tax=Delitschia confertaspora ATCC 74209 TaxID=1513339 RepID=A0A9P4JSD2_9PLEO|nr:hypothetical protein GQ43DRAFT_135568 [Delitschia confertaspora ATCC 74209]
MTWICHHPDTCGQKCSKRVPWDPLLERGLPKVSCEDLDMEKVAIYADSPLDTILHIPWEEDALASYISAHPMPTNGSVNSDSSSMTPWAAYSAPSGILTSIPPAVTTSTPGKVSSVGLGVSLGIGLPCGVALMGFVTYFWLRRRHQKASVAIDHHGQEKYHHEESPDSGGGGGAESRFTTKAELSAAPMDPAELESVASPTIQSPIQSHPGSVRTSMISPTTSEFNDLGGGPGPVERWEVAGNEIRPVYELEG